MMQCRFSSLHKAQIVPMPRTPDTVPVSLFADFSEIEAGADA